MSSGSCCFYLCFLVMYTNWQKCNVQLCNYSKSFLSLLKIEKYFLLQPQLKPTNTSKIVERFKPLGQWPRIRKNKTVPRVSKCRGLGINRDNSEIRNGVVLFLLTICWVSNDSAYPVINDIKVLYHGYKECFTYILILIFTTILRGRYY